MEAIGNIFSDSILGYLEMEYTKMANDGTNFPHEDLQEATIEQLQTAMQNGELTAHQLVQKYIERIKAIDWAGPHLRSVLELNPDAEAIAQELDRERRERGPRGPLHGIPILIKDNIDTADKMLTTAGSLALIGTRPQQDAFVAQKLREAGAIILGKTNLSEWANIRSSRSSSGWSGRGRQCKNPYVLDRNPSGSSSGSGAATSANLCVAALATETDGSIVSPANSSGVVGIKPTVGLTSRAGVIPISHSQDTVGPHARTVRDAAIVLGALVGVDPRDAATSESENKFYTDYTQFLDVNGLAGARIGVVRKVFSGFHFKVDALMEQAIQTMKAAGAIIVDPADIPTADEIANSPDEMTVLLYELKADLNAYLSTRVPDPAHPEKAIICTLEEIIAFNKAHAEEEMPFFGQEIFEQSQAKGSLIDPEYLKAFNISRLRGGKDGIDKVLDEYDLDALIAPTGAPAWLTDLVDSDHSVGGGISSPAAIAGYPLVTLPAGFVYELPVGITFVGRAWSEPTLLKLAYAFEQATQMRRAPKFLPTLDLS